jgi:hypothetical protein
MEIENKCSLCCSPSYFILQREIFKGLVIQVFLCKKHNLILRKRMEVQKKKEILSRGIKLSHSYNYGDGNTRDLSLDNIPVIKC